MNGKRADRSGDVYVTTRSVAVYKESMKMHTLHQEQPEDVRTPDVQTRDVQTLDVQTVASMLDVSAVQANSTREQVRDFADVALRYDCKAVFVLPCFLPYLRDYRAENGGKFLLGAPVGFPSGGTSTAMKVLEAKSELADGAEEIDMMLNVGYVLSGMYREALDDIRAVKEAVGPTTLKVIIECHYLDNDLIRRVAGMVVEGGAQWVKTGTGWTPTGATLENVALLKRTVGDAAKVKASGGVRSFETVREMHRLGVERFGVGGSARTIL
ncbi:MAG TPA: deoxyribose-phosphate aldolase, partial [Planctomycetaceae bacterium]|nr:deoxyribose-phosphate aldolase [Planctomycetaceae bacterium]